MSSLILPYAGLDAGQPASLSPDYRSTVARSPRQAPIAIPQTLTEVTGPTDWSRLMGPAMAGMLIGHDLAQVWVVLVVGGQLLGAVLFRMLRSRLTDAQDGVGG